MINAYGAKSAQEPLAPLQIERRKVGPADILIEIKFCGICHSDIHMARNEWGGSRYPVVPGHEIVGVVTEVGSQVKRFKAGETVGVGCFVDSCRTCAPCQKGLEQYCERGMTGTYNGKDTHLGGHTFGGYSSQIVVDQNYVLRIPKGLDLAGAAPLLCAGITTYSPLKKWGVGKGSKVAILGLGGLGHMGVKIAKAMGAEVTVVSRTEGKRADALRLGATHFLNTQNAQDIKKFQNHFDFILDTIAADHDLGFYLSLLKPDCTMVLVGLREEPLQLHPFSLVGGRKALAGSLIGGIAETQEMLDFCAKHNLVSDIELITAEKINIAYERTIKSDVKYRFVIDASSF